MATSDLFAGINFSGMISALLINNYVDGSINTLAVQINKLQPSVMPGSKCEQQERVLDNSCLALDDELKQSFSSKTIKLANFIKVNTFKVPRGMKHPHDNINHHGIPHGHSLNSNESEFYPNSHASVVHSHDAEPRYLHSTLNDNGGNPQEFEEVIIVFLDEDPQKPYYLPLAF